MDAYNDPHPMRILLISPRGPLYRHKTGIWKKSLRYQPLTLTTLASLVPLELNADVVLDGGFQGFIAKPAEPGELRATVMDALRNAGALAG